MVKNGKVGRGGAKPARAPLRKTKKSRKKARSLDFGAGPPILVKAEGKAYNAGLELHDLVKDLSNCQATRVAEAFISGMFQRERPSEKWVPGVKAICAVVMDLSSLDFIDPRLADFQCAH
jgi:hypothetical protein